jgi:hypothetical protein
MCSALLQASTTAATKKMGGMTTPQCPQNKKDPTSSAIKATSLLQVKDLFRGRTSIPRPRKACSVQSGSSIGASNSPGDSDDGFEVRDLQDSRIQKLLDKLQNCEKRMEDQEKAIRAECLAKMEADRVEVERQQEERRKIHEQAEILYQQREAQRQAAEAVAEQARAAAEREREFEALKRKVAMQEEAEQQKRQKAMEDLERENERLRQREEDFRRSRHVIYEFLNPLICFYSLNNSMQCIL